MRSPLVYLFAVVTALGCGHSSKAKHDAGADAAPVPPDAQLDLSPDASPDVVDVARDAPSQSEAGIAGIAMLIGQVNHAGTTVRVEGRAASAMTAADGAFLLPLLPAGDYSLLLDNGEYHEVVPNFRVKPSGQAVLFADREYPLAPIELPRARRLVSGERDRQFQDQIWPDGSVLNVASRASLDKPYRIELLPASGKAAVFTLDGADPPAQLAKGVDRGGAPVSRSKLFFRENTSGSLSVGMLVALDLTTLERKELGLTPGGGGKLSHDEQLVLKLDATHHVQLVRLADGKVISTFDQGDPLDFSPDDQQLAFSVQYVDMIAPTDGRAAVPVARDSGDLVWMSGRVVFTRAQVREPFGFSNGLYWAPGL